MIRHIKARYHQGVFRPTQPVQLREGTEVEVSVPDWPPAQSSESAAGILRRIASLPLVSHGNGFSGEEHDRELYR
jgi:predicted DNA-binding antitoxin AbrB/MazE fold protein